MSNRSKFKALSSLATVVLLTGSANAADLVNIKIGLASGSLPSSSPRIAKEMGLFAKHGLDPNITIMESSSVVTTALISRSVDFSVTAPSDAIIAQAKGQPAVAVATVYGGYSAVLVLSKQLANELGVDASAPVEKRLKALDGQLIGSTSAISNFTLGAKCALATVGSKATFTYMSQPAEVAAFETGSIKSFISAAPFFSVPVAKGTGVVWLSGPNGDYPEGCGTTYAATLNTMRQYADANPEVITKVKAVFADFAQAVHDRPDEVKDAISQLFPDVDRVALDLIFQSESERAGFGALPPSTEGMAKEIEFIKASGVTIPGIEKVNPASVVLK
jgi:ABC-type nitrate/sulfonate/bicarbonate transport system substrate-binding protein